MAVISLPLTFNNSFWTQDYRKGLEVLFAKLDQGVIENSEILAFIRTRANIEGQLATSLLRPGITSGKGFGADDGASLLMAFRGLQEESIAQGKSHQSISSELHTLVADPFAEWAQDYKEKLGQTRTTVLDHWVRGYEQAQGDAAKLRHTYLAKTRKADDADDDAKFAPNNSGPGAADHYTTSPRIRPVDGRSAPQRTASVSERIAQRLKEIQNKNVSNSSAASSEVPRAAEQPELEIKLDKGKGKELPTASPVAISPPPLSPPLPPAKIAAPPSPMPPMEPEPILLAGLSLPPAAVSQLLTRAAAELPLRPVRFPLIGEYPDCFHGEEFVIWLKDHVHGLGDSFDRAEDAAKDLAERDGLLRRVGEFGNRFEFSDEAFYQFRPKAFELGHQSQTEEGGSPRKLAPQPVAENIIKRTNTFLNVVSRAMNNQNNAPVHIKARQEAEEADREYRVAVRRLDRHRLGLEERIEETLKKVQRWETERLRAVKTVLLQFQGTLSNIPKPVEQSIERSATLIAAYNPDSDLSALIERYRTGPFRPSPQLYESISHDEFDVVFGIDLRRWADGGWNEYGTENASEEKKDGIPPALTVLLSALQEAYKKLPNDDEKRKSWIYEVPLGATHHLRETLNAAFPARDISNELLAPYDAPVLASGIKLWMLELDPPLVLYEGWDEIRKLYPTVGSGITAMENQEQHIEDLSNALHKLPRIHLLVLDAVISHLRQLLENTTVSEPDEVYLTKLALTVGRTIIRPKFETELSVQDRHPTLLLIDLVKNYDKLLPPTIARKKRESVRKMPIRKRTKPVDMRVSRSRLSVGKIDPQQLFAAQQAAQNPSLARANPPISVASPPSAITTSNKSLPDVSEDESAVTKASSAAPKSEPEPESQSQGESKESEDEEDEEDEDEEEEEEEEEEEDDDEDDDDDEEEEEEESEDEDESATGEATPTPAKPVFREAPPELDDLPPRPMFREPPPEQDGLPPRPQFADPISDDDDPPPRPNFREPPPEDDDSPASSSPSSPRRSAPANIVGVIPPTPQDSLKRNIGSGSRPSSPLARISSTSPTPPSAGGVNEDEPLSSGRASIRRAGSGQTAPSGVRGPRISRGPRGPNGGSVSNIVNNFNKNAATPASPTSPSYKRLSTPGSRPSSVVGRSSLQRRTMASDAEDDLVEKK